MTTAGGAAIAGAFLGGVLGQSIGPQWTLVLAGGGEILACMWIAFSPVRRLRTLPNIAANV